MASADTRVDWYGEDVMLVIEGASDEILTAAVFQGEALIKTDPAMRVDTGFMRNAIYGIGTKSHRMQAEAEAHAVADRELAPEPDIPDGEAAIHAAAKYTIYVENRFGFIYNGLQKLARYMGGIIAGIAKR